MKILVYGCGAVGSVFAAFLRKAGAQVTCVGREPHVGVISSDGLTITGVFGTHLVRGIAARASLGDAQADRYDWVLLTTKTYDNEEAALALRPLLARSRLLVLQNGLGQAPLFTPITGKERYFQGRVIFGAEIEEPGRVRCTVVADATRIGQPGRTEPDPEVVELCQRLSRAGLPAAPTGAIEDYLWGKTLYSCALNPLGAVLERTYGEVYDNPHSRHLLERFLDEAFAVVQLEHPSFPYDRQGYRVLFASKLLPPTRAHLPSMLHDLKYRGRTEVESFNGYIARRAAAQGLQAPYNESITLLIHALEARSRHPELAA